MCAPCLPPQSKKRRRSSSKHKKDKGKDKKRRKDKKHKKQKDKDKDKDKKRKKRKQAGSEDEEAGCKARGKLTHTEVRGGAARVGQVSCGGRQRKPAQAVGVLACLSSILHC